MDFEILGPIRDVEPIATGREIRQLPRLRRRHGKGRWRKRKGGARVRVQDGTVHTAEIHLRMKKARRAPVRFAVCIKNKGYEASLEKTKLYRVVPDQKAEAHGYLRIVDESGEDYGYAASHFFAIDLPKSLEKALLQIAS
jgi:hypothetical protein